MPRDPLHDAVYLKIETAIEENYRGVDGSYPVSPTAVATLASLAALAAIEEQGKVIVGVSDLVAAITVLATADDTCMDAACWREACQLLVRLRAALPDVALEPSGTLQGEQATGPGISGRSDLPEASAGLSAPHGWNRTVNAHGIPIVWKIADEGDLIVGSPLVTPITEEKPDA